MSQLFFHSVEPSTIPAEEEDDPPVLHPMYKTKPVMNADALNAIAIEAPAANQTGEHFSSAIQRENIKHSP
jgi:hypothetical protein